MTAPKGPPQLFTTDSLASRQASAISSSEFIRLPSPCATDMRRNFNDLMEGPLNDYLRNRVSVHDQNASSVLARGARATKEWRISTIATYGIPRQSSMTRCINASTG